MKTFSEMLDDLTAKLGGEQAREQISITRYCAPYGRFVPTAKAVAVLHKQHFPEQYNPSH